MKTKRIINRTRAVLKLSFEHFFSTWLIVVWSCKPGKMCFLCSFAVCSELFVVALKREIRTPPCMFVAVGLDSSFTFFHKFSFYKSKYIRLFSLFKTKLIVTLRYETFLKPYPAYLGNVLISILVRSFEIQTHMAQKDTWSPRQPYKSVYSNCSPNNG